MKPHAKKLVRLQLKKATISKIYGSTTGVRTVTRPTGISYCVTYCYPNCPLDE